MKYCPYCGSVLEDDMMFCPVCGKKHRGAVAVGNVKPADADSASAAADSQSEITQGENQQEEIAPEETSECPDSDISECSKTEGIAEECPPDEEKAPKKHNKKIPTIIGIAAVVVIAIAAVLYVKLYKIPHDEAIAAQELAIAAHEEAAANYNAALSEYNAARASYDAEVAALETRNQELDNFISSLTKTVNSDDAHFDDSLREDANNLLDEARKLNKDSAPEMLAIPEAEIDVEAEETETIEAATAEVISEMSKITEMIPEVQAMGNYSDTLELLSATETEYQALIDQFEGCNLNLEWYNVDEEWCVLRFVTKLSNPNSYALKGVVTEWVAYDKDDAIVGYRESVQPDIPANGEIVYIGGAGSANLSGTPVRVEVKVTYDGLLTNRQAPQIAVSDIQLINEGYGSYTASALCTTDSDIESENLDGQFILKDADGTIIDADFWSADNLPATIDENGKFTVSNYYWDLPAKPVSAEIYMYYKQE